MAFLANRIGASCKASTSGAKPKGSRFAALEDHDEMEMDMWTLKGVKISGTRIHLGLTKEDQIGKSKETEIITLQEREEASDDVRLGMSQYWDLTTSLKPLGSVRSDVLSQGSSLSNGSRKIKEKAHNEIKNKLDVRPIKLKPSRVGTKLASGQQKKMQYF